VLVLSHILQTGITEDNRTRNPQQ